jgi:hypothetical protein
MKCAPEEKNTRLVGRLDDSSTSWASEALKKQTWQHGEWLGLICLFLHSKKAQLPLKFVFRQAIRSCSLFFFFPFVKTLNTMCR